MGWQKIVAWSLPLFGVLLLWLYRFVVPIHLFVSSSWYQENGNPMQVSILTRFLVARIAPLLLVALPPQMPGLCGEGL